MQSASRGLVCQLPPRTTRCDRPKLRSRSESPGRSQSFAELLLDADQSPDSMPIDNHQAVLRAMALVHVRGPLANNERSYHLGVGAGPSVTNARPRTEQDRPVD